MSSSKDIAQSIAYKYRRGLLNEGIWASECYKFYHIVKFTKIRIFYYNLL